MLGQQNEIMPQVEASLSSSGLPSEASAQPCAQQGASGLAVGSLGADLCVSSGLCRAECPCDPLFVLNSLAQILFESIDRDDPTGDEYRSLPESERNYYRLRVKDLLCHANLVAAYYVGRQLLPGMSEWSEPCGEGI